MWPSTGWLHSTQRLEATAIRNGLLEKTLGAGKGANRA